MTEIVYDRQISIGNETFKVVLQVKQGAKLDGGLLPYHFFEVQRLPDSAKYFFQKGEVGMEGKYGLILNDESPKFGWPGDLHNELTTKIKSQTIPAKFLLHPELNGTFF